MTIDSKVVDRTLVNDFWPALSEAGFTRKGRTAWRRAERTLQVVTVRSFNSYLAAVLGSTTFSFGVSLGVFLDAIADHSRMTRFVRDRSTPREPDCHIRMFLTKGFDQSPAALLGEYRQLPATPEYGSAWIDRPDLWYVLPDGSNLGVCANDARERILEDGIPWLARMSDERAVIDVLQKRPDQFGERGVILELIGGALGSPGRWQKIGSLAAVLGDRQLLAEAVAAMSEQDYWNDWPEDLETLRVALAGMS